jgi:hypothetical protein
MHRVLPAFDRPPKRRTRFILVKDRVFYLLAAASAGTSRLASAGKPWGRAPRETGQGAFMFGKRFHWSAMFGAATLAAASLAAPASTLISENFADNPVTAGRAAVKGDDTRFFFQPGKVTAHYDTKKPTAMLLWNFGGTLDQSTDFSFSATFTIKSLTTDPFANAQIAFGLVNSATTGDNRSGGPGFSDGVNSNDIATFDYFPNNSPFFDSVTLVPTVVASPDPSFGPFDALHSVFGTESVITDPGEVGILALNTTFTGTVSYLASQRLLTLTLADAAGALLNINNVGDAGAPVHDGDVTTIRSVLPAGTLFSADRFGIQLWQDFSDDAGFTTPGVTTLLGDVEFTQLTLTASAVPEPTTLTLIAGVLLTGLSRKSR